MNSSARWAALLDSLARRAPSLSFLLALAVRAAVVFWARDRFPPVEDGRFYHVVASRIAQGLGYTWLWPDGAVTYAAHYPVGYPALIGGAYAVFGPWPVVAMAVNALLGSLSAAAVAWMVCHAASERSALFAGLAVALHPALVLYTPALMTEGVTASLLVLSGAAALAAAKGRRRWGFLVLAATLLGITALIRPQCLLVAPLYGALCVPVAAQNRLRLRLLAAVLVSAIAVAVCTPWTLRNCSRMGRCVFVSANGGWNLLIGTALHGRGTWVPLEQIGVPSQCRTEFREAFKDSCFGGAAVERIAGAPLSWLGLVPDKLGATFDYSGAPGWYLHAANARAFDFRAKIALGSFETLYQRVLLALGLLALGVREGPRRVVRFRVALGAALLLLTPFAWPAYLAVPLLVVLVGRGALDEPIAALAGGAILATALAHVVFFGAGRYSLVCFPLTAALAGTIGPFRARARASSETLRPFDRALPSG